MGAGAGIVCPLVLRVNQSIRLAATTAANPAIPKGTHGSADRRLMSVEASLGDADNCLRLVEERRNARLIVRAMFRVTVTGTELRQMLVPQGT